MQKSVKTFCGIVETIFNLYWFKVHCLVDYLCCIRLFFFPSNYKNLVYLSQSSGSGSESGIQTQQSVKSKNCDDSGNSSDSNDDENGSVGLNARDGSDNGSGTQVNFHIRSLAALNFFNIVGLKLCL